MKNIRFKKNRLIKLKAKKRAKVQEAVQEAIEFCKENQLKECELCFNGFLFDIEQDSDINIKLEDYNRSMAIHTPAPDKKRYEKNTDT